MWLCVSLFFIMCFTFYWFTVRHFVNYFCKKCYINKLYLLIYFMVYPGRIGILILVTTVSIRFLSNLLILHSINAYLYSHKKNISGIQKSSEKKKRFYKKNPWQIPQPWTKIIIKYRKTNLIIITFYILYKTNRRRDARVCVCVMPSGPLPMGIYCIYVIYCYSRDNN